MSLVGQRSIKLKSNTAKASNTILSAIDCMQMQQVKKPNDNKHCASSKTINIQEENHKINIKTPSSRHQACTQSDNAKSIKILQSTTFLSSESIASTIIQLQAQVQRASLRSQHKHKSKQASNSPYNPPTSRAAYDPPPGQANLRPTRARTRADYYPPHGLLSSRTHLRRDHAPTGR